MEVANSNLQHNKLYTYIVYYITSDLDYSIHIILSKFTILLMILREP